MSVMGMKGRLQVRRQATERWGEGWTGIELEADPGGM